MSVLANRRRVAVTVGMALPSIGFFLARPYIAQAQGVDEETQFTFNTFAFLVWGALVMEAYPEFVLMPEDFEED